LDDILTSLYSSVSAPLLEALEHRGFRLAASEEERKPSIQLLYQGLLAANGCVYLVQTAPFIVSPNTVAMAGYSGGFRLTVR